MATLRRGGLLLLLPFCLAFTTSVFLLLYISFTSKLYDIHVNPPADLEFSKINTRNNIRISVVVPEKIKINHQVDHGNSSSKFRSSWSESDHHLQRPLIAEKIKNHQVDDNSGSKFISSLSESDHLQRPSPTGTAILGTSLINEEDDDQDEKLAELADDDVFHDRSLFMKDYKQMNKTLKIYAYPHNKNDPFANVLLPLEYDQDQQPGGNYASESYFKKSLFKSHFLTSDPSEADLFYLPFSIAALRHDKRVGVGGIQKFVRNYIVEISGRYPYWNRSGGADHFYVACHSVGRTAMEKAVQVRLNAIQVVCSSSYFLPGYVSHKDASIPQIWPRNINGRPPILRLPSQRKKLGFYAGAMNSRVREFLIKTWSNDSSISVHESRLKTPYSEALLDSKFCIHAKGFEVNTARIGDALYYGCVPVILADHYDLPYADVLNWNTFSVVVSTMDISMLKKILEQLIDNNQYLMLHRNVIRVQKHFLWHKNLPLDYDAFHMVMYELWLRRSHVRLI